MELKSYLKSLKTMHLFLVAGLGIFTVWSIFQLRSFNTDTNEENILLYIVPVAALIGYFGSQIVFKKMTSKIDINSSLQVKLKKYQSALHLKYALIEFPAFIGLFAYFNSGNALPLVISLCLLAYLFSQKPTVDNILNSIPLNQQEKSKLQKL